MIEKADWYQELTARFDKDPKYWVEAMRFDFVEEVERMMEERGVSRAELARRLDASPAYVTQLLRALFNPTLLTLAKIALALDARISLQLHPAEAETCWFDYAERRDMAKSGQVEFYWPRECEPIMPPEHTGERHVRTAASAA